MAIKAYVGRMGSGKTYEVVSVVILGALARGRRVVSNIAGLDYPSMLDVLVAGGVAADQVGELVQIEHAKVLEPNFWRTDKDAGQGIEAFIQPGDLVALDEIWRFWEGFSDRKMPERVMNFYRMHRHFTHSVTGLACDVALITQDVMDIARKVRAVIEEIYSMEKLTAIGSTKRYRVDVHQGGKTSRRPLRSIQRSYEEKYFPLYKSHSQAQEGGAGPREENIDQRGNILRGALFRVVLPLGVLVMVGAVWMVWKFLHPAPVGSKLANEQAAGQPAKADVSQAKPAAPEVSDQWRVVGYYMAGAQFVVLLADHAGRSRLVYDPPQYQLKGLSVAVVLPEGTRATMYGGAGEGGLLQGPKP